MCNSKIKLQYKITGIPYGWRNHLCLKESGDGFAICHDNHWFGGTPKYMPKFFESHVNGKNSFAFIDILIWDGEYVFEPQAMGAYVLRVEVYFWFGSSSINTA